jgi:hypothetical protein
MRKRLFAQAAAAALALSATTAAASSGDNAAAQVVVPFVVYDREMSTTVFVHNHEPVPLTLQVRYVGERSSARPGYRRPCPNVTVPALGVVPLDLRDPSSCGLGPNSETGTLLLLSLDKTVIGRFSASARIDVDGPSMTGRHSVLVDGLPLAALDSTDNVHRVPGLRADRFTNAGFFIASDCYVGAFFDAAAGTGMIGRLTLKDADGQPLGRDQFFSLKAFELYRFRDVFAKAGVNGSFEGVQAEFNVTGHGAAFLAYCTHEPESADGRTFALTLAQVAESRDETRKRIASAVSTPGVHPPMTEFTLAPGAMRNLHGLYVRRPDVVSCGVTSTDFLNLTAVAPDGTRFGGTSSMTGDFATIAQGTTGENDLWGLEVSWDPTVSPGPPATYSITCKSGNGTSLMDQLVR